MVEESSPSGGGVTVAIKGLDLFYLSDFILMTYCIPTQDTN